LDEAITLLSESLKINPSATATWNSLAGVFVQQGKIAEARNAYENALKIDPRNDSAAIGLELLNSNGDPLTEIRVLTKALKSHPDFTEGHKLLAEAHYNAGNAAISSGNIGEAQAHYEQALQENPNHVGAHCNLGLVLFRSDKSEQALPHAETAVRLNPDSFEARYILSEILLRLGKFSEAETQSRAALNLQPEQPLAQNGLALALAGQQKWPEAETAFSRALALAQQTGDQRLTEEISRRFAQARNGKR
jgi:tetratricopeptide (TPR) repeat protein